VTIEGRNRFSINVRYPQDLRNDVERLKRVLVPVTQGGGGDGMKSGAAEPAEPPRAYLAQMGGMEGGQPGQKQPQPGRPRGGGIPGTLSDAPLMQFDSGLQVGDQSSLSGIGRGSSPRPARQSFVPLGQVAEVHIVGGPPMVRDEGGLLVGYVYVDIDQSQRDIGGYVQDAKRAVDAALRGDQLVLPAGTYLKWTGQYEQLEKMAERMRLVIPATLLIIVVLLFLHFRNFVEVLIVLLSIPFALVGSVWLLWALDYRLSTAVWVGIIALVGLAAQTGIVMIVYIDNAYERRRAAGKIRDLSDIIWAHMEGTVMRVRPKLMTVATMLCGLIPLLWATGSGADVMKRIAAPMVGGLITSAFLTLEIIPVVYTYWRQEQVLWERLAPLDAGLLETLQAWTTLQSGGWVALCATGVARFYWESMPRWFLLLAIGAGALAVVVGSLAYLRARPAARRQVWPKRREEAAAA
jgi:Cu(I)/Ag(I) efflux system membrane protein CusA/SilA